MLEAALLAGGVRQLEHQDLVGGDRVVDDDAVHVEGRLQRGDDPLHLAGLRPLAVLDGTLVAHLGCLGLKQLGEHAVAEVGLDEDLPDPLRLGRLDDLRQHRLVMPHAGPADAGDEDVAVQHVAAAPRRLVGAGPRGVDDHDRLRVLLPLLVGVRRAVEAVPGEAGALDRDLVLQAPHHDGGGDLLVDRHDHEVAAPQGMPVDVAQGRVQPHVQCVLCLVLCLVDQQVVLGEPLRQRGPVDQRRVRVKLGPQDRGEVGVRQRVRTRVPRGVEPHVEDADVVLVDRVERLECPEDDDLPVELVPQHLLAFDRQRPQPCPRLHRLGVLGRFDIVVDMQVGV